MIAKRLAIDHAKSKCSALGRDFVGQPLLAVPEWYGALESCDAIIKDSQEWLSYKAAVVYDPPEQTPTCSNTSSSKQG
jgi:hypothetical protein